MTGRPTTTTPFEARSQLNMRATSFERNERVPARCDSELWSFSPAWSARRSHAAQWAAAGTALFAGVMLAANKLSPPKE